MATRIPISSDEDLFQRIQALERRVAELESPTLALKPTPAAKAMGISRMQLWRLRNLEDGDPRKIHATKYGTVPIAELERHLKAEVSQ